MRAYRRVPGGIPDFGRVVDRPRITTLLAAAPPGLSLLVAPSGYGKSVAAAQFARRADSTAQWIDFSSCSADGIACLERVIEAIEPQTRQVGSNARRPASLRSAAEDLTHSIVGSVLGLADPEGMCLVLDDVPCLEAAPLEALAGLADRLAVLGVRTLITARSLPVGTLGSFRVTQILDYEDLRLTAHEALSIASQVVGLELGSSDVQPIVDACAGHPAVFSVLVRHAVSDAGGLVVKPNPSLDLRSSLIHLAHAATDMNGRRALFVMALLGKGDLQDLAACGIDLSLSNLRAVGAAVPLLRVGSEDHGGSHGAFLVHDLAQEVFLAREYVERLGEFAETAWPKGVKNLTGRGELLRSLSVVETLGSAADLVRWLQDNGEALLLQGGAISLSRAMRTLAVSEFVQHPELLLLQAQVHQEKSELPEAIEKARVAKTIADHERDGRLLASSLLLSGQCYVDMGDYGAAFSVLADLASGKDNVLSPDQQAWTYAALGICSMYMGLGEDAIALAMEARVAAARAGISDSIRVFVTAFGGAVDALVRGDFASSLVHFARSCEAREIPRVQLAKAQGNLGVTLCEMGRLERSVEAVGLSLKTCLEAGIGLNRGAFLPVQGAASFGLGATESGIALMREGIDLSLDAGDRYGASYNRIYLATALRAAGRSEASLAEAEQALEFFSGIDASSQRELATLELGASLLAIDDVAAASRTVEAIRSGMSGLNAYHLVRADMILAESERRRGEIDKAVARLMTHEEYILSESSNWQIAMYCRAFPELLGLFVLALGTEQLPAHLMRMILPENAEIVLAATKELLEPDRWSRLGQRLLGEEGFAEYLNRGGRPLCRVRLFGGLEVNVAGRIVSERDWRKRKARLLFAMLVIRGGQDVPRDQVLEHLWPDMDEARAKNNLYVIWSAMKSALSPEAGKNEPCPYVDNTGGVCRVMADSVRSDVEEFERTLSKAREAQAAERISDALGLYERLAEIYRGELLPGDVYDDWFAHVRDEFRAKYADAMLQAASLLQARHDQLGALTFIRRALNQDPWREDLYQAALRCQIAAGQRSAAIDTYLLCRSKLTEDLGLDPSAETRALYDQILAMEDRPAPPSSSFDA